ncbi:hypothetical protein [Luteolibacter soli]|uniref:Uncharacterized protein n=1 Tax=Luteolibacter soli TaxID=3135280 RepID=A0ABU9AQF1_9BACT
MVNGSLLRLTAVAALFLSCLPSSAQEAKTEKLAPILAKDVSIYPYSNNRPNVKIDPKTKGIFDEHKVTVTAAKEQTRIRIKGEMKNPDGKIEGAPVLHLGKIAMIPISERAGALKVGEPAIEGSVRYIIVLEVADDKLKTDSMDLKKGVDYNWSVAKKDGQITFAVFQGGEKKWSVAAPENDVKAFGIGAFTRFEKQRTEIDFSINN